ncbi:Gfo/Idh/MocA family protein [Umezawaea endophytica]|uniref:Gfo/Idh/MocA family oxidoreductase n=1 Tax=Umezawaea endophytica TaxID=1654476 RepID=A0A9X3AES9_9PSEU|nr:Gfo/Idh/MocA family oxidoreductase [Umezawaea endophytica]MCS7477707.1 Gfo/Idh/MocA family oxidoreductase [Umezawaea endophytica]
MRFALVGAGVIGEVHARLITSLAGRAELAAVVDVDAERARSLTAEFGGTPFTSLADALADVDAVSVCLPSGAHADAAVLALAAGKHVVVEKPIDITLAAADRIATAEQDSGRTVAVISQRRFQRAPAFVRRAVVDGRFGRITSGTAESTFWRPQSYYDSGGWRGTRALDGGGALMNQGVHAVDLLLWLMGEPVEVVARSGRLAHDRIDVEDTVAAVVTFASGAIGTITATTAAFPGLPVRIAVHGDRGGAVVLGDDLAHFHTADGDEAPDLCGSSVEDAHRAQYADFLDAVRDGRPPLVGTADGRRALAVVLAAYESARTGAPVALDGDNQCASA